MGVHAIPNDVLERILLRLDSPLCLLRAASACKQWRFVIAGAAFLRRFRSLHGRPPVAAVYHEDSLNRRRRPDLVTLPPDAIDGCFFSLDFLPDSNGASPWVWRIEDSRGSLLLLDRLPDAQGSGRYRDMIVCEPLTRMYMRIAPRARFAGYKILRASLIDGESGGGISMSNFQVVCQLYSDGIHSDAGFFTMGSNQQYSWRKKSIDQLMLVAESTKELTPDSLYWYNGGRRIVALDRSSGKFSSVKLPEFEDWDLHKESFRLIVTAGRDGKARVILSESTGDLKVFARLHGSGEWVMENSVRLSVVAQGLPGYVPWCFNQRAEIHKTGTPEIIVSQWMTRAWWSFYLDIETIDVAPAPDPDMHQAYPCELPWPPSLQACTDIFYV